MEHGDHSAPAAKRFGVNSNGVGIAIVAIVAVCLSLFCWSFWKDGSKEINHYRLNTLPTTSHEEGTHGQGEKPGVTPSSSASETVAPSTTINAQQADTVSQQAAADSAKEHKADSAAPHTNH